MSVHYIVESTLACSCTSVTFRVWSNTMRYVVLYTLCNTLQAERVCRRNGHIHSCTQCLRKRTTL